MSPTWRSGLHCRRHQRRIVRCAPCLPVLHPWIRGGFKRARLQPGRRGGVVVPLCRGLTTRTITQKVVRAGLGRASPVVLRKRRGESSTSPSDDSNRGDAASAQVRRAPSGKGELAEKEIMSVEPVPSPRAVGEDEELPRQGPAKIDMGKKDVTYWENFSNGLTLFLIMHYIPIFWLLVMPFIVLFRYGYPWPLYVLLFFYVPWYIVPWQRMGGRPSHRLMLRRFWKYAQRFMHVQVEREVELDPSKQYMFCWHPHGILLLSRFAVYGGIWDRFFPGINVVTLAASPLFWIPPIRDITILLGGIDASRTYAVKAIEKKTSLAVYPGGSKEIYTTDPYTPETVLVLKKRRGFIRLALKYNLPLVPMYVFGEKYAYHRLEHRTGFGNFLLRTLRLPFLIFWGRWATHMPRLGTRLAVVIGRPLELPKVTEVTDELVEEQLRRYTDAVVALFNRHKDKYSRPGEFLHVV